MANRAYLSLGTNIEPEVNLRAAVDMLSKQTRLMAISSVWESKAVGMVDQANFLNAAALVETGLTAVQLKETVINHIEQSLGRVRQADKNAPRTIDIDIMLFNEQVFKLGQRHIPDAEVLERAFVAVPLAEISPDYQHPETGQTLREIARTMHPGSQDMQLRQDICLS